MKSFKKISLCAVFVITSSMMYAHDKYAHINWNDKNKYDHSVDPVNLGHISHEKLISDTMSDNWFTVGETRRRVTEVTVHGKTIPIIRTEVWTKKAAPMNWTNISLAAGGTALAVSGAVAYAYGINFDDVIHAVTSRVITPQQGNDLVSGAEETVKNEKVEAPVVEAVKAAVQASRDQKADDRKALLDAVKEEYDDLRKQWENIKLEDARLEDAKKMYEEGIIDKQALDEDRKALLQAVEGTDEYGVNYNAKDSEGRNIATGLAPEENKGLFVPVVGTTLATGYGAIGAAHAKAENAKINAVNAKLNFTQNKLWEIRAKQGRDYIKYKGLADNYSNNIKNGSESKASKLAYEKAEKALLNMKYASNAILELPQNQTIKSVRVAGAKGAVIGAAAVVSSAYLGSQIDENSRLDSPSDWSVNYNNELMNS